LQLVLDNFEDRLAAASVPFRRLADDEHALDHDPK
jgi:hypothetical protein